MPTIEQVRAKIQRNFPKERSPLRWARVSDRIIRSTCGRFQIERRGDEAATRYFAFMRPDKVIGARLGSAEQAKTICEQHASPLPLEPVTPAIEREPGCDDDLGDDS